MKRIAVLALAISLVACQQTSDPANQRAVGTLSGMFIGAFIGYSLIGGDTGRAIMTVLGAAAGGAGGYYATDYIIKRDQQMKDHAAFLSLDGGKIGSTVYWENEDTGSAGSFTVLRTFKSSDGRRCREFTANTMGVLRTVKQTETACQLSNGSWEII